MSDNLIAFPRIVAFTGYAREGKDSAGEVLERMGYVRRALSDKLKAFVYSIDESVAAIVDYYNMDWEAAKDNDPYVRSRLVEIAEEAKRILSPTLWVDVMTADFDPETKYVVTGVRFVHEAEKLREMGSTCIFRVQREGSTPANEYETEIDHIEVDGVIRNNGVDLALFQAEVKRTFLDYVYARNLGVARKIVS